MEALLADPVPESLGARWPAEESNTVADVLGGGEHLVPMADGSTAMPKVATETVGTSGT